MNERYQKYKKSYKRYRESHKEELKRYREDHREKLREMGREWQDKDRFGEMRNFILERDNYTCQDCGMTQEQHWILFNRSLTIDHIDGKGRYSKEKNNDPDNLITLCLRCHGRKDRLKYLAAIKKLTKN